MSIYPVKISGKNGWFKKGSAFEDQISALKIILPSLKCNVCGNPITWEKGYVSHGIVYGYDDQNYCSYKCLRNKTK